ncbi:hypothetical protein DP194_26105 [Enterobacter hormaechei subsp. xiangfangensis]|nr:hypothetical protein DP194_26105 [Enterobacter hormaechei subsp. xiangfangensis]
MRKVILLIPLKEQDKLQQVLCQIWQETVRRKEILNLKAVMKVILARVIIKSQLTTRQQIKEIMVNL